MAHYNLNILGFDVSFKAEADPKRIDQAKELLEERYAALKQHGKQLGKDKLLMFLALALADDMLQARDEMEKAEERLRTLLDGMDNQVWQQTVDS